MTDEIDRDNSAAPRHHAVMDAYWAGIGEVDPDVITYLLNPMFSGAPAWPNTRQAYRVVRTPSTVILASDGLADPEGRDGESFPGFGCEVFLETPDLCGADFEEIKSSPHFQVIQNFAQNVANSQGISGALEEYGVLSIELPVDIGESPMATEYGTVGCLVGLPSGRPATVDSPVGRVDIIALTVMTPSELEGVVAGGAPAREEVATARAATGAGHVSTLRASAPSEPDRRRSREYPSRERTIGTRGATRRTRRGNRALAARELPASLALSFALTTQVGAWPQDPNETAKNYTGSRRNNDNVTSILASNRDRCGRDRTCEQLWPRACRRGAHDVRSSRVHAIGFDNLGDIGDGRALVHPGTDDRPDDCRHVRGELLVRRPGQHARVDRASRRKGRHGRGDDDGREGQLMDQHRHLRRRVRTLRLVSGVNDAVARHAGGVGRPYRPSGRRSDLPGPEGWINQTGR
ncbi:hypothetical protein [Tsukamurella spumae]|uniref:Suppressor of fused-like domain-containing protein n=1 Tax=Tsukamurella spumae TaxID=44753 RepID=A0A846X507_9ACTN|nr:hypothetical protein [Tsukamurella spumae]NKY19665.1 hypothetical protein [Tsukamurella spumae]